MACPVPFGALDDWDRGVCDGGGRVVDGSAWDAAGVEEGGALDRTYFCSAWGPWLAPEVAGLAPAEPGAPFADMLIGDGVP